MAHDTTNRPSSDHVRPSPRSFVSRWVARIGAAPAWLLMSISVAIGTALAVLVVVIGTAMLEARLL